MSDVAVKCTHCGLEVRVSEFVDQNTLVCSACGHRLPPPRSTQIKSQRAVRPREWTDPALVEAAAGADAAAPPKKRRWRRRRDPMKMSWGLTEQIGSWVMFFVLAPLLVYLRFAGVYEGPALESCKYYGMIGFGVFYLVIVIEALKEDMFDGLLCVFVPFYPLFYLFTRSGSLYLRALMAGFVLGFGYDVFMLVYAVMGECIKNVNEWIQHGALE